MLFCNVHSHGVFSHLYSLEAFVDLKVAGGDLLEGPGIYNIL